MANSLPSSEDKPTVPSLDVDSNPWYSPEQLRRNREQLNRVEFQQEFQCEWRRDPNQVALMELAAIYHRRCDAYDISVCLNKEGIPRTGLELRLVNQNTSRVFSELMNESKRLGFVRSELHQAIVHYGREYI